jgi:hypothetical protein
VLLLFACFEEGQGRFVTKREGGEMHNKQVTARTCIQRGKELLTLRPINRLCNLHFFLKLLILFILYNITEKDRYGQYVILVIMLG